MSDRPAFDPSKIAPPTEPLPGPSSVPPLLSVRQVTALVKGALARALPATLHVVGEIGDFSRADSGHLYFTLKDSYSELRCVMWRSAAARMKFRPQAGLGAVAVGAIEVYEPRGVYQLIVHRLEPRGIGALELAFRQLKEKLAAEGLFDPARKKPIPKTPFCIGLVTSPSGAAIRDMIRTARRRFSRADLLIFPVRVQGEGAAAEIAGAIAALNTLSERLGGIDVMIVGRGGGSIEDLWAFNEEVVARAVAASRIPVISAVGHETDFTICDFVADLRAATPTAAAELATPVLADLLIDLEHRRARVQRIATHLFQFAAARLEALMASETISRPTNRIRQAFQQLDECIVRIRLALAELLRRARRRVSHAEPQTLRTLGVERLARNAARIAALAHAARVGLLNGAHHRRDSLAASVARLERAGPAATLGTRAERLDQTRMRLDRALSHQRALRDAELEVIVRALAVCDPKSVVRRGYSITRDARTRAIIRSVAQVRDAARIVTEVADGSFPSTADDPRHPGLFDPPAD